MEMSRPSLLLLLALVLGLALGPAGASVHRITVTECPHHPGHCKDPDTGDFHANGEQWARPGVCHRRVCEFPDIEVAECDPPEEDPHCQLNPGDATAAYPDCCPSKTCPSGHNHV